MIAVEGHPDGPWDGPAGRLVACVGTEERLVDFVAGVASGGPAVIERWRRRSTVSRWLRAPLLGLFGRSPVEARTATLVYAHRVVARWTLDGSSPDPALVTLPYFGEPLDEARFQLEVFPPVAATARSRMSAVILVQRPRFSTLERRIQRRVAAAVARNPGWLVNGEWATEEWVVRSAATAERVPQQRPAAR